MKKEKTIEYLELDKEKHKKLQNLKKQGKINGNICPVNYMKKRIIKIPKFDWRKDKFWKNVNIKKDEDTTIVSIDITKEVRKAIKEAIKEVFDDIEVIIEHKYYKWEERKLLLEKLKANREKCWKE